jgi:hypothetical protein
MGRVSNNMQDPHVPPEGRDLIRKTLHEKGVTFSFYEPAWAQHSTRLFRMSCQKASMTLPLLEFVGP